jgi:cell division protein FtsB
VEILLTINNLAEKMVWNVLYLQKQMDKLGSENMVLSAEIVRLKKELEFTKND